MLFARKASERNEERGAYAKPADFGVIFLRDMRRLYFLAFLLVGHDATAEQCILSAFDTCIEETSVLRQYTAGWSRRSVIKSAIKVISPKPFKNRNQVLIGPAVAADSRPEHPLRSVRDLPAFDRFVFVMSVLERYSLHECSSLLNCSASDVCTARIRALKQITAAHERQGVGETVLEGDSNSSTHYYIEARVA